MLLVNNVPFSIEIFEWVENYRGLAQREIDDDRVVVFKELLPKEYLQGKDEESVHYSKLKLVDFFVVYRKVMDLSIGVLDEVSLSLEVSVDDIREELDKMFHVLMIWIHHDEHGDHLGSMEPEYVNEKTQGPNQNFVFVMYHIVNEIESRFVKLQDILSGGELLSELGEVEYNIPKLEEMQKFIHDKIILTFDLNDFVMETCDAIKDETMTDNHKILAIHAFDKKFDKDIPKFEAWRRLYPNYFDKLDVNYETFWEAKQFDCIRYFLNDYLRWDISNEFNIVKVPFFKNIYLKDCKLVANAAIFVCMKEFEKREKKFYKEDDELVDP